MREVICVLALVLTGCGGVSATTQMPMQYKNTNVPIRLIGTGCYHLASGQAVNFKSPAEGWISLNTRQGVRLIELGEHSVATVVIERSFSGHTGEVSYIAELDRGDDYQLSNTGRQGVRYCYQIA